MRLLLLERVCCSAWGEVLLYTPTVATWKSVHHRTLSREFSSIWQGGATYLLISFDLRGCWITLRTNTSTPENISPHNLILLLRLSYQCAREVAPLCLGCKSQSFCIAVRKFVLNFGPLADTNHCSGRPKLWLDHVYLWGIEQYPLWKWTHLDLLFIFSYIFILAFAFPG